MNRETEAEIIASYRQNLPGWPATLQEFSTEKAVELSRRQRVAIQSGRQAQFEACLPAGRASQAIKS
jgi:hypothetical protein